MIRPGDENARPARLFIFFALPNYHGAFGDRKADLAQEHLIAVMVSAMSIIRCGHVGVSSRNGKNGVDIIDAKGLAYNFFRFVN
ncbi:hypothetical protein MBHK15_60018 [Marinobacter salarius]|nr:hypothetical protein MBHK15_60018 [Marinobacter salarius]